MNFFISFLFNKVFIVFFSWYIQNYINVSMGRTYYWLNNILYGCITEFSHYKTRQGMNSSTHNSARILTISLIASLLSHLSPFFMRVSFASSKSCIFYVQVFCPHSHVYSHLIGWKYTDPDCPIRLEYTDSSISLNGDDVNKG